MTKTPLPRIASALLAGAFAVVPVAATVALAPPAAAIAHLTDDAQVGYDADALTKLGITPASADLDSSEGHVHVATEDGVEAVPADPAEAVDGGVEFRDEDGNLVDRDPAELELDRAELARRGIATADIEPISAEMTPVSANIDETGGLSSGVVVAFVASGVALFGGGVALGRRARAHKA
ncbi:hypothetical protein [Xylanimonas sp. McL0601]|uniref:hypothetical protein n=1 Tax=Xylanimonas sp. McL0601 TaxID=3414739 RepID=UPI003CF8DBDA